MILLHGVFTSLKVEAVCGEKGTSITPVTRIQTNMRGISHHKFSIFKSLCMIKHQAQHRQASKGQGVANFCHVQTAQQPRPPHILHSIHQIYISRTNNSEYLSRTSFAKDIAKTIPYICVFSFSDPPFCPKEFTMDHLPLFLQSFAGLLL